MKLFFLNKQKNLHQFIAWRYYKSKYSLGAIQIISKISIAGIAVSVAALIVVLSVFNGFESLIKNQFNSYQPDIKIIPAKGKTLFIDSNQIKAIQSIEGIKNIQFITEGKAVLTNDNLQSIIVLRGVDSTYLPIYNFKSKIVKGSDHLGDVNNANILFGIGIESILSVDIVKNNQPLLLYVPNNKSKQFDLLNGLFSFTVIPSGIFLANDKEIDETLVLTNTNFAKQAFDYATNEFSYINLKITGKEKNIIKRLNSIFLKSALIQNKYSQNETLFSVINNEKWIIFFILTLIMIISSFNILSTITMLIIHKQKDIQIFQAMGMNRLSVMKIFIIEGMILSTIGMIVGLCIGLFICWLENTFHLIPLNGDFFIIDYYPVKIILIDIIKIIGLVYIISFAATILPAFYAANKMIELKN